MQEDKFSIKGSFQQGKDYIDSQLTLLKLKTIERSSRVLSSVIIDVAKIVFALMIIFFL